jgi:fibronectin-binding autotransporter adhesin
MKVGRISEVILLTTTSVLFAVLPAQASSVTWDSGPGITDGLWASATNWIGDVAPVAGDSVIFNIPSSGTRTTTNNFAVDTLFGGIAVNAAGFSLSGSEIYLSGNVTQSVNNSSSGATTVNIPIVLQQDAEFVINSLGAGSYRWDQNAVISGSYGLTKSGNGVLRINTATWTYTGDTLIKSGTIDIVSGGLPNGAGKGNVIVTSAGTLSLNNTSLGINGLSGTGTVVKIGTGGRILTVGNGDANGNFAGNFVQSAGTLTITKTGNGTQIISGSLNNTGTMNVNGGTLIFNGTHTAAVGNYTVGAGGTLGGTGTILFATAASLRVNSGGALSPGNSAGLLTLSGGAGMTMFSNSSYMVELNGLAIGTQYDSTLVNAGTITLNTPTLAVSLGFTPNIGASFDIITNATGNAVSGTFLNLPEGSVFNVGDTQFQITYLGGTGNDVVLTVVPEPSTVILAGFGVGVLVLWRRRSRSA